MMRRSEKRESIELLFFNTKREKCEENSIGRREYYTHHMSQVYAHQVNISLVFGQRHAFNDFSFTLFAWLLLYQLHCRFENVLLFSVFVVTVLKLYRSLEEPVDLVFSPS